MKWVIWGVRWAKWFFGCVCGLLDRRYTGSLPYRQSTSSAATGAGDIMYTTYKSTRSNKYVWLAMFYSPTAGIARFKIDGNTGANGYGATTWGPLGASSVDSRYHGWYKKVFDTSKPSINHLIIAPGSAWAQTASSNTNLDIHTLTKVSCFYEHFWHSGWLNKLHSCAQTVMFFMLHVHMLLLMCTA